MQLLTTKARRKAEEEMTKSSTAHRPKWETAETPNGQDLAV